MIKPVPKPRPFPRPNPVRFPKRKPMTIAMGFRYDSGILVCSDSQYTAGIQKLTGKKVFRAEIREERLIFAIAGSVPYGRMAVEKFVTAIDAVSDERTKGKLRQTI